MRSIFSENVYPFLFSYKVDREGFDDADDESGLFVAFDNEVIETRHKLEIGTKTLVTRIGGVIGVGKELFWINIFIITSSGLFESLSKILRRLK